MSNPSPKKKDWRRRSRRGPSQGASRAASLSQKLKSETLCERCEKPGSLCVCNGLERLPNRHFVVVLQHPQEPDKLLGTAKILTESLEHSILKVALSVASLKKLLGSDEIDPKRWGVLYLGSGIRLPNRPESQGKKLSPGIHFTSKDGELLSSTEQKAIASELEGIVLLDGTWSQAKALWWRNPWLLKLRRMILIPTQPSLYRELRKEPRGECLSTLETAAETLAALGEDQTLTEALRSRFTLLLEKYRSALKESKARPESESQAEKAD